MFDPCVGKIPWRRKWQPTPVFLPGKSQGQRSLADYCPWGHKESDTTERLHFLFNWRIVTLNIVLVSAIHQHESAIGIHTSPPSCSIVMCDEKWILYNCWRPTQWWTKKKLQSSFQSQTCTKKGLGHCLMVSDPWQLSESWRNHCIWEICSINWWGIPKTITPEVDTGQQKGPVLFHNNTWPHVTQPMF